ncbi:MAG TPA: nuclease-related domain-containing protein [Bacillus sp. (in: firmicutes)]|nr:nuclease-related domain-containing protein [Bacillus sp. (in: firmicutes)]
MIDKIREIPIQLQKDDALLRLLPHYHEKYPEILRNTQKGWAGYNGEKELDYHLTFLNDSFTAIPSIRIPMNDKFFQMDTLLLTPYFSLIIESKNIFGTLHFDSKSNQMIRIFNDQEEGFPNPITQAKRQTIQFKRWLAQHVNKEIPVYFLVAIGSPKTIVKGPSSIFQSVLHAEHFPDKIHSLIKQHSTEVLTPYLIKKISKQLIQQHTPAEFNPFSKYNLTKADLIQGIKCPNCKLSLLVREYKYWRCRKCSFYSSDAHKQKMIDYLTICRSITINECQTLLQLPSRHMARHILLSVGLVPINKGKATQYKKHPAD